MSKQNKNLQESRARRKNVVFRFLGFKEDEFLLEKLPNLDGEGIPSSTRMNLAVEMGVAQERPSLFRFKASVHAIENDDSILQASLTGYFEFIEYKDLLEGSYLVIDKQVFKIIGDTVLGALSGYVYANLKHIKTNIFVPDFDLSEADVSDLRYPVNLSNIKK